jgi:hypothetical protein
MVDSTTGEIIERCLEHENDDVERFYAALPDPARVGIEATINARSFVRSREWPIVEATVLRAGRPGYAGAGEIADSVDTTRQR